MARERVYRKRKRQSKAQLASLRLALLARARYRALRRGQGTSSVAPCGTAEVTKKEESREDCDKVQPVTVVKTKVVSLDESAPDDLFCTEDRSCDDERVAGEGQSSESALGSRTCGHMSLRPGHHSPRPRTALVKKSHSAKAPQQGGHLKALKDSRRFCQLRARDKRKKAEKAAAAQRSSSQKKSPLAGETSVRCDSMLAEQHWDLEIKDESCAAIQLDMKEKLALPPFKVTSRFLKTYSRPRERRPLSDENKTKEAEDVSSQTSDDAGNGVCIDDGCKTDRTVRPPSDAIVSAAVNSELVKTDNVHRECSVLVCESKAHKAEESLSEMLDVTEGKQQKCDVDSVIKATICPKGMVDRLHSTSSLPRDGSVRLRQTRLEVRASQVGTTLLLHGGPIRTASEETVSVASPGTSSFLSTHGSLRENLRVLWNVGTQTNLQRFSKWTQTTSFCC